MLKLCALVSGSSGNCIYVGNEDTHILIDAGITKRRAAQSLASLDVDGNKLDGILVTHEHSDHVGGLGVISRAFPAKIYATRGSIEGIKELRNLGEIPDERFCEINRGNEFQIGSLTILPIKTSHDAYESCGYRIFENNKSVAVVTDLGYYTSEMVAYLEGVNAILLESNHDILMLETGPYPYHLKQRVLGERGHLSNENCGRLLADIMHDDLQGVLLGHLSAENNFQSLAFDTVKLILDCTVGTDRANALNMSVAGRDIMSELLRVN
ncbi:MAG: MBL fold metallo-hydrolase [Lachnospiraceae bacterium]|jgi:phosphoribosyl 1,2-cyclic phosphodiesterase|nr:MBL fold metallo-hydrolase [Lachnospiraceae bacterium]